MVVVDMIRSGLLVAPPVPTQVITQAPTYRDIPAVIFNGVPDELKVACGLPPGQSSSPVPIPNDGIATLLHVGASVEVNRDSRSASFVVQFDQVVPKPFCMDSPTDFVLIQGPLTIEKTVHVDKGDAYNYRSTISGRLMVVPVDVTQSPPLPIGEPFYARIGDFQQGRIAARNARVRFSSKRIAPQDGGLEMFSSLLKVATHGRDFYNERVKCIEPE